MFGFATLMVSTDGVLELERERLQAMPIPWPGAIQNTRGPRPVPIPRGYQHSLKVYEELISVEAG